MRRTTAFLFLTILALGAGCMDYDETIHLNKDGSGTIEIRMAMDEEAYRSMLEMAEEYGEDVDGAMTDLSEEKIREQLAASGSKAKLLRYEESTAGTDRVWEMKLSFEKPEDLAGLSETGEESAAMFTFAPGADGNWRYARILDPSGDAAVAGEEEAVPGLPEGMEEFDAQSFDPEAMEEMMKELGEAMAEMEGMMSEKDMEEMSRSMEALGGFGEQMERMEKDAENRSFRFTVHFPGEVVESNAGAVDGKTAVWEYRLADMQGLEGSLTAVIDR